jgi:hypothetical protein
MKFFGSLDGERPATPSPSSPRAVPHWDRRMARPPRDLPNIIDAITKKDAGLRSLADDWADTTAH